MQVVILVVQGLQLVPVLAIQKMVVQLTILIGQPIHTARAVVLGVQHHHQTPTLPTVLRLMVLLICGLEHQGITPLFLVAVEPAHQDALQILSTTLHNVA